MAPVLAACNTSPGAAAVIGGSRISVGYLQSQVDQALANPSAVGQLGGSRAAAMRAVLSRMIQDRLINRVAAAHHVALTASDISTQTQLFVQNNGGSLAALQQSAAAAGYSKSQLTEDIREAALIQKLEGALTANLTATPAELRAEYQKNIDQFDQLDIAQIELTSASLANKVLREARANPARFGALARKYSTDSQTASSGGQVGYIGRHQVAQALGKNVADLHAGAILLVHSSGGYVIVHLIKRRTQPLTAVLPQLKAELFANKGPTLLNAAVIGESRSLGVHISPRYGHWDAVSQAVALNKNAISFSSS